MPPENWDALRQFRDRSDVPVCVGERLYTRWQFRPVLEQKLAEYIMPDIIRTGGISEMKKIASMAEAFFVPISPHDATGPITLIAGAHDDADHAELLPARNRVLRSWRCTRRSWTRRSTWRTGYMSLSERPGLGHELRADYLEQAVPY